MIRLHRQFSLARLIAVTCVLAINFAWVPWPGCLGLAVGIVVPLFVSGFTVLEWIVIYGNVGVLTGLLTPAVVHHHSTRKSAPSATAPAPTVPSGSLRPSQGSDEPEGSIARSLELPKAWGLTLSLRGACLSFVEGSYRYRGKRVVIRDDSTTLGVLMFERVLLAERGGKAACNFKK